MKRKTINGKGINWDWLDEYSSKVIRIDGAYKGFISLVTVIKVKKKITVDYEQQSKEILFDDGYKCLVFLPDNEKWCVSVVYNRLNEVVEWYFDITKVNSIDEQGNPFFDDLYIDIAISPDFKIVILDEDELKEALESKVITKYDYDMAYATCNKIIKEIIPNREFLISFFDKYLTCLK